MLEQCLDESTLKRLLVGHTRWDLNRGLTFSSAARRSWVHHTFCLWQVYSNHPSLSSGSLRLLPLKTFGWLLYSCSGFSLSGINFFPQTNISHLWSSRHKMKWPAVRPIAFIGGCERLNWIPYEKCYVASWWRFCKWSQTGEFMQQSWPNCLQGM